MVSSIKSPSSRTKPRRWKAETKVSDVERTCDNFLESGLQRFSPETTLGDAQAKLHKSSEKSTLKALAGMGVAAAAATAGTLLGWPLLGSVSALAGIGYAAKNAMDAATDSTLQSKTGLPKADNFLGISSESLKRFGKTLARGVAGGLAMGLLAAGAAAVLPAVGVAAPMMAGLGSTVVNNALNEKSLARKIGRQNTFLTLSIASIGLTALCGAAAPVTGVLGMAALGVLGGTSLALNCEYFPLKA